MFEVELPDGRIAEFPDSMTKDQALAVVRAKFPTRQSNPLESPMQMPGMTRGYAEQREPIPSLGVVPAAPEEPEQDPILSDPYSQVMDSLPVDDPLAKKRRRAQEFRGLVRDARKQLAEDAKVDEAFAKAGVSRNDLPGEDPEENAKKRRFALEAIDENLSVEDRMLAVRRLDSLGQSVKDAKGVESLGETTLDAFGENVPILGGWVRFGEEMQRLEAKQKNPKDLTIDDLRTLNEIDAEAEHYQNVQDMGSRLYRSSMMGGEIVGALPGFVAELSGTGMAGRAGKLAGKKLARKVMGNRIRNKMVRNAFRASAGELGAWAVQGTALGAASGRSFEKAAQLKQRDPGMGWGEAVYKGWLDTVIEVGSERFGNLLGGAAKSRFAKGVSDYIKESAGGKLAKAAIGKSQAAKMLAGAAGTALGYAAKSPMKSQYIHGPFVEMIEERVGDLLRGATGVEEDYGMFSASLKDALDQLAAEAMAFALPAAANIPGDLSDTWSRRIEQKKLDSLVEQMEAYTQTQDQAQYPQEGFTPDGYEGPTDPDEFLPGYEEAGPEPAQMGAETAQMGAETAQMGAETAQMGAETAQTGAETAQTGAETAQMGAVQTPPIEAESIHKAKMGDWELRVGPSDQFGIPGGFMLGTWREGEAEPFSKRFFESEAEARQAASQIQAQDERAYEQRNLMPAESAQKGEIVRFESNGMEWTGVITGKRLENGRIQVNAGGARGKKYIDPTAEVRRLVKTDFPLSNKDYAEYIAGKSEEDVRTDVLSKLEGMDQEEKKEFSKILRDRGIKAAVSHKNETIAANAASHAMRSKRSPEMAAKVVDFVRNLGDIEEVDSIEDTPDVVENKLAKADQARADLESIGVTMTPMMKAVLVGPGRVAEKLEQFKEYLYDKFPDAELDNIFAERKSLAPVKKKQDEKPESNPILDAMRKRRQEDLDSEKAAGDEPYQLGSMKLGEGEVVKTTSGRDTTPFPKLKFGPRSTTATLKRVEGWLKENAIAEAESRGDSHLVRPWESETPGKVPQATKDEWEYYLFDPSFNRTPNTERSNDRTPNTEQSQQDAILEAMRKRRKEDLENELQKGTLPTFDPTRVKVTETTLDSLDPDLKAVRESHFKYDAKPVLDLGGKPTGWKSIETIMDGIQISDGSRLVVFVPEDKRSGRARARAMAKDFAISNAIRPKKELRPKSQQTTTPTAKKPLKKKAKDARDQVTKDRDALIEAIRRKSKGDGTVTSGVDPELLELGYNLVKSSVKAGVLTFADFANDAMKNFPADVIEPVKPYLEAAWQIFHEEQPETVGPAGKFSELPAVEEEEEEEDGEAPFDMSALGPQGIPVFFASGMQSGPKDIRLRRFAGSPIGVAVQPRSLSPEVISLIQEHANNGNSVFLDSGVFQMLSQDGAIDWPSVFQAYDEILAGIDGGARRNVFLVMPDHLEKREDGLIVGDQEKSMDLISENLEDVNYYVEDGVNLIVPIQKGPKGLAVAAADYSDYFRNFEDVVIGIPYNVAAWSDTEILDFVKSQKGQRRKPLRLHLLGGGKARGRKLWEKIKEVDPTVQLSGDSATEVINRDRFPVNEPGDVDYGSVGNLNLPAISEWIASQIEEGKTWGSITQFRASIGKLISDTIAPGTVDAKLVEEAYEMALFKVARSVRERIEDPIEVYRELVRIYERQPRLGTKTDEQIRLQAYSTPVPLSWAASVLAGVEPSMRVFDSSAGNGLLLFSSDNPVANELGEQRAQNLRDLGVEVTEGDAMDIDTDQRYPRIIINPPFGKKGMKRFELGDTTTKQIDHAIAFKTLEALEDDGKAVVIIGAKGFEKREPKEDERRGESYANEGKFYRRLYDKFNVVDHFTIHGDMYSKQGASFPIDIIVIDGKGKSQRVYPFNDAKGGIPRVIRSWKELEDVLKGDGVGAGAVPSGAGESRAEVNDDGGLAGEDPGATPDASTDVSTGEPGEGVRGQSGELPGDGSGSAVGADSGGSAVSPSTGGRMGQFSEAEGDTGGDGGAAGPSTIDVDDTDIVTGFQSPYTPRSGNTVLDTLVPANHADAIQKALDRVVDRYGDIDAFVKKELQFDDKQFSALGAEQVDVVALAIARAKEGKGFINGDQTGIGKGRAAAAMLHWAKINGMVPLFVTEKPKLYADMIRDLTALGVNTTANPYRFVVTNRLESKKDAIELPEDPSGRSIRQNKNETNEALKNLVQQVRDGDYSQFDGVFTTYSQFLHRTDVLSSLAPHSFMIFDESHNALGQEGDIDVEEGEQRRSAADYARMWLAESKGNYFSSATFAKRAGLLDLYASAGLDEVGDIVELRQLFREGGVPLQQAVSEGLVKSGAYMRREKTFEGVEFEQAVASADPSTVRVVPEVLRAVNDFDRMLKPVKVKLNRKLLQSGRKQAVTNASGQRAMDSVSFASRLHNVISQFLLALKADAIADQAIADHKAGRSPVIYVDSTMETKLEEAAGGASDGSMIDFDYPKLLKMYLAKTREVTVYNDVSDRRAGSRKYTLTDEDILSVDGGAQVLEAEKMVVELIESVDLSSLKASPLDWIRQRITDAGLSFAEMTGRKRRVDYSTGVPLMDSRPADETGDSGQAKSIGKFNKGEIDIVMFNVTAATGVSMHASKEFENQKPRSMVIGQAALNIDTFMQSLGRIHRTGQVITQPDGSDVFPKFTLLMTDAPSELRPAAVLSKKLASLNANVTASDKSNVSFDVPDIMNVVGDQVVQEKLTEDADLADMLGFRMDEEDRARVDFARQVTGRLAIAPYEVQEEFWQDVTIRYKSELKRLDAKGENPLSAGLLDIRAKKTSEEVLQKGKPESDSVFQHPVNVGTYQSRIVKKPWRPDQVKERIERNQERLGVSDDKTQDDVFNEMLDSVRKTATALVQSKIDKLKDDKAKDKLREQANVAFRKLSQLLTSYRPGMAMTVQMYDGKEVVGIIYDVLVDLEATNPLALSKHHIKVAVPHVDRNTILPFSFLAKEEGPSPTLAGDAEYEAFDQKFEAFVEYKIATGNILAASKTFQGGHVRFFTHEDGQKDVGVILGENFSTEEWKYRQPAHIQTYDEALEFLNDGRVVRSKNGVADVTLHNGVIEVELPRAKARNKSITTNDEFASDIKSVGSFVSSGDRLVLRSADPADQKVLIESMIKHFGLVGPSQYDINVQDGKPHPFASMNREREDDGTERAFHEGDRMQVHEDEHVVRSSAVPAPKKSMLPEKIRSKLPKVLSPKQSSEYVKRKFPFDPGSIIKTMEKLWEVPIRARGMGRRKGTLGIYRTLDEVVRTLPERSKDLYVMTHEVGHHIDKMLTEDLKREVRESERYARNPKKMEAYLRAMTGYTHMNARKLMETGQREASLWGRMDDALRRLDYQAGRKNKNIGRAEGFAELTRRMLLGDIQPGDAMKPIEPAMRDWWLELIERLGYTEAYEATKEMIDGYHSLSVHEVGMNSYSGVPRNLRKALTREMDTEELSRNLYTYLVDSRHPLKVAADAAERKREKLGIKPLDDITAFDWLTATAANSASMVNRAIEAGVFNPITNRQVKVFGDGKPLAQAFKELDLSDIEMEQFMLFGLARHTLWVHEKKPKYNTGMDHEVARKIYSAYKSNPRIGEAVKVFTDFNDNLVYMLYDVGIIDADTMRKVITQYRPNWDQHGYYWPLLREQDPDGKKVSGGNPMMRFRTQSGSGDSLLKPLHSLFIRANGAYRNVISWQGRQLMVEQWDPQYISKDGQVGLEGMGRYLARVPPKRVVEKGRVADIADQLIKGGWLDKDDVEAARIAYLHAEMGIITEADIEWLRDRYDMPEEDYSEEDVLEHMRVTEPDIMMVFEIWRSEYDMSKSDMYGFTHVVDGKPVNYEVSKEIYEAIEQDPELANWMTRSLGYLERSSRAFKVGATGLSLSFALTNLTSDMFTMMSTLVRDKDTPFVKGMVDAINDLRKGYLWAGRYAFGQRSALLDLWNEYGGDFYTRIQKMDAKSYKRLERYVQEGKDIGAPMDFWRRMIAWSDMGPRLRAFESYLESVGYELRDGKFYRDGEEVAKLPLKHIIKGVNAGKDVTYNYTRSGSFTWLRFMEILFPFTRAKIQGSDKVIRTYRGMLTGKQSAAGFMAYAMLAAAWKIASMMHGDDDDEQATYLKQGYLTIGDGGNVTKFKVRDARGFNMVPNLIAGIARGIADRDIKKGSDEVLDTVGTAIWDIVPAGGGPLRGLFEVAANYDYFRGESIVSNWHLGDHPRTWTDRYTTDLGWAVGQVTGTVSRVGPVQVDHLARSFTGGLYNRSAGTLQAFLRGDFAMRNWPMIGGSVLDRVQRQSITDFYDRVSEVQQDASVDKPGADAELRVLNEYEGLMTVLRKSRTEEYDPTVHVVAIARQALGKPPLKSYPSPFAGDLPDNAKTEMVNELRDDLLSIAGYGKPRHDKNETDEEYAEALKLYESTREGLREFVRQNRGQPLVEEAVKKAMASTAYRNLKKKKDRKAYVNDFLNTFGS